ncbi:MAG: DUF3987 domain-containing protein [Methylobacter sp.]
MNNTNQTIKEVLYIKHEQQIEAAKQKEAQQLKVDKNSPLSKKPKNHNDILDNEQHHCTVDFLQFINDSHLLKQLAIDIAKATHLPEHTTFLTGLGVFSSIACRKYKVDYLHNGSLPIGLYIVAEQPSGTGKSRSNSYFQEPFNKAQNEYFKERKVRLAELKEKEKKKGKGNFSREEKTELEQLSKDQISFFITNSTPEALEETLNFSNGFFSAISSEQGLFNSMLGLSYGEGKASNNDLLLNGFDAGNVASIRVTREGYSGKVIGSVVMFAQPGSIEKILGQSNGTGLSERFLLLAEQHKLGTRDHTVESFINHDLLNKYNSICESMAKDILENCREYNDLISLKICKEGHRLIAEYRNTIENNLADGGKYSHISLRGAAGKINMQIMKIAANLHILESQTNETIAIQYVQSAIDIANSMLEANLKLCIDKGIIGRKAEYVAILRYFEKHSKPISDREIINSMRGTLPFKNLTGNKSGAVREALGEMVAQRLLLTTIDENKVTKYSLGQ